MKKGPKMKEYTLIIKGEMDFIILSPQVLSSLITQIHNSPERKVVVSIESIMPPKFTDYLLRVINSNRFSNERFRYRCTKRLHGKRCGHDLVGVHIACDRRQGAV